MNILHMISGGELGGSKNHLLSLSLGMKEKKVKNIIVCFLEGKLYHEAKEMGLDVRLIKQNKRFDLKVVELIKDLCQEEKIDIVNCHGGRANFVGSFLKKKYRATYVSTVHSDYRDDYKGNKYKTLIYSNLNKFSLKAFDSYLTVSENFKTMLVDRGFKEEKIKVIYNGIDFKKEKCALSKAEIIDELGIKRAESYVGIIARFHPVKGHEIFLRACAEVLKSNKDVVFILAGDGEEKENIINLAKELGIMENLFMPGFKAPDKYFKLSNFTVMTSYTESFPLAILESTMYAKTVISTEVGGINKLIIDGENGYLFKPGDYLTLAARMLELITNPAKTIEFGEKLQAKAQSEFSLENMIEAYIRAYKEILDEFN